MSIYDCFLYDNEKHCLEIRGEELKSLDVTHVLIESPFTFTGKSKSLNYWDFAQENHSYNIRGFLCHNMPNNGNAWDNEVYQRNYIMTALEFLKAQDDDIVIISDADEIPYAEAVKMYSPNHGVASLSMDLYYYYLNCLSGEDVWRLPKIMTYKQLKSTTPNEVRQYNPEVIIWNAGWHFSYLGGTEAIQNKIRSFSHQELNTEQITDSKYLSGKLNTLEYLWDNTTMKRVEIDDSFPETVFKNQDKYSHLIKK